MQPELRRPVLCLSPGPLGVSALAIGGRSSRPDSWLPGHIVGESYTPSIRQICPIAFQGFSHFAGVTIYVWFIKIRLRASLKVCGCWPAPETGVVSATPGGTKSVQSAEGDLLGSTGPTFKQMSAGSKRSGRKTLEKVTVSEKRERCKCAKREGSIYDCSCWRSPFLPDHVRPREPLPVAALAGWGEGGPLGSSFARTPQLPLGRH